MRVNRKHFVIYACIGLCVFVSVLILLHRPKRNIVIEIEGPANHDYQAILVVDGKRTVETVSLPKTYRFFAREVSYGVSASEAHDKVEISGHAYLEDKSIDFSSKGSSVGGNIKSPKLFGIGSGDFTGFTGIKDSPFLAESD